MSLFRQVIFILLLFGKQILNLQTLNALPAWELINLAALVGRFYWYTGFIMP